MVTIRLRPVVLSCVLASMTAACGDGGDDVGEGGTGGGSAIGPVGFDEATRAEMEGTGVTQYLGAFTPSREETTEATTTYYFDAGSSGPICIWGSQYMMSAREGASDSLIIYLEGGGACWSELCAAKSTATVGIMPLGWTDPDPARNPFGDWDTVFASYCDGSVFSGDNEIVEDGGAKTRYHRGLRNLSAALDIAKRRFPSPERIVLAGSSAGGYGTLVGTALVRMVYPTQRIFVFNDAGLGLSNPEDPDMVQLLRDEWRFSQFIPPSCPECQGDQLTTLVGWGLEHDRSLKVGAFSSYGDFVIAGTFLKMEPEAFKAHLFAQTDPLQADFPERFGRYFITGTSHTAILAGYYDPRGELPSVADWARSMVEDEEGWGDEIEPE